jgi:integrase
LWRLFAHCESRGYIPRGANPVTDTERFNGLRENAIEVWTPDEMVKLLAAPTQGFLPCLAIGGFAGLRTSEILALDWGDVRLAERTVKVTHRKSRCAGTRLAPITENLAKWLSPLAKKSGPVWPTGQTWRERARSITAAQNATADKTRMAGGAAEIHETAWALWLPAPTNEAARLAGPFSSRISLYVVNEASSSHERSPSAGSRHF